MQTAAGTQRLINEADVAYRRQRRRMFGATPAAPADEIRRLIHEFAARTDRDPVVQAEARAILEYGQELADRVAADAWSNALIIATVGTIALVGVLAAIIARFS